MAETLSVHLNRDGIYDVEAPSTYEATGTFSVVLRNHGSPIHVHLHVDDDLSAAATLDATNHYIEAGATRVIEVVVDSDRLPASGVLDVRTGHGTERRNVEVALREPAEHQITVDESLTRPAGRDGDGGSDDEPWSPFGSRGNPSLPVMAFAGLVLLLLLVVAAVVGDPLTVAFAAVAVVAGFVTATYLLRGETD